MADQIVAALLVLAFILPDLVTAVPRNRTGFCEKGIYPLVGEYTTQFIDIPVDHFHNESRYAPHSDRYFKNRWWFDDRYYKPGGPVIIENGGESSDIFDLTDLRIGWLHELAKATNGIAVTMEHRYYGQSIPVDLRNAHDFRFMTVQQAMADEAYFAQNVVFPGKEHLNLTAPNTPWFAIGCSYPGGLTAFERIQYPDLFWGAISSSGVTVPTLNFWEYYATVSKYSPPECVSLFGKMQNTIDHILRSKNATAKVQLKEFFNFPGNSTNPYFVENIEFGYALQFISWLGCENDYSGIHFCSQFAWPGILFPKAEKFKTTAEEIIANGGWANETQLLVPAFLNYLGLVNGYPKDNITASSGSAIKKRSKKPSHPPWPYHWIYQQCTEWGFWMTADAPGSELPITTNLIDLHEDTEVCRKYWNVSGYDLAEAPIDRYGRFNVSYPRLMLVGGERDPWRQVTPLAERDDIPTRLDYPSTPDQPWYVIPEGTHCWDFEGVFPYQKTAKVPPPQVVRVKEMEKGAFRRWLAEWHEAHPDYNVYV